MSIIAGRVYPSKFVKVEAIVVGQSAVVRDDGLWVVQTGLLMRPLLVGMRMVAVGLHRQKASILPMRILPVRRVGLGIRKCTLVEIV